MSISLNEYSTSPVLVRKIIIFQYKSVLLSCSIYELSSLDKEMEFNEYLAIVYMLVPASKRVAYVKSVGNVKTKTREREKEMITL